MLRSLLLPVALVAPLWIALETPVLADPGGTVFGTEYGTASGRASSTSSANSGGDDVLAVGPFLRGGEPGSRSIRALFDAHVYAHDAQGRLESIGFVSDLILDPDGRIRAAVVALGGFLTIGSREILLGYERFEVQSDPDTPGRLRVISNIGVGELANAPEFDRSTLDQQIPPVRLRSPDQQIPPVPSVPAPPLIGDQVGAVSPDDADPGLALPAETIEESVAINGNATGGRQVWPSRTFGSEDEFPPERFAGYGIVAFNSQPDAARGRMFCEAFTRALLTVQQQVDRGVQIERQMVTVWPMESSSAAAAAREAETTTETCDIAVRRYGLGLAEDSIWEARQAELAGTIGRIRGRGPFLLAWAPGESKGSPDVLVLVANLSDVATPEQAVLDFERWKDDIQRNSELWERGWSVENVRIVIQRWADGRSGALLSLIGLRP